MIFNTPYFSKILGAREDSFSFAMRCVMLDQPYTFSLFLFFGSMFLFAQAVRISEAPLSRVDEDMNHKRYDNSLWAVFLTMSTVGFGDYFARTSIGRFLMFLCAMAGNVIVSIFVVVIMNILEMSPVEDKAYIVTKRMRLRQRVKMLASKVICGFVKTNHEIVHFKPVNARKIFNLSYTVTSFKNANR